MSHQLIKSVFLLMGLFSVELAYSQETFLYKEVDSVKLYLEVHAPAHQDSNLEYPAMVFFFGGGWKSGDRQHFIHHAQYFAQRGIVCFLADYRIKNKHQTSPFESLMDAKSAMRYIRANASDFHIDPDKIIASGGSAGGQLALATALIEAYDDPNDNLSISCVPNALVLFNPVFDNGPGGYGYERVGAAYKDFSPLHNIQSGAPPSIVFLGTNDRLVPVETAHYFAKVMENVGSRCELKLYEGGKHGFFNYQFFDNYQQTVLEADAFLQSLGYLKADPKVEIK